MISIEIVVLQNQAMNPRTWQVLDSDYLRFLRLHHEHLDLRL